MESTIVGTRHRRLVTARAACAAAELMLGLLVALPCAAAQDAQVEQDNPVERIRVPSTKVRLAPPEGFVAATTFPGFQHVESGSSIMVNTVPGLSAEIRLALEDPKQLAKQGMELLAREDRAAGKYPGTLLHMRQRYQQVDFEKWMWVFGSENETVMIVGTYPAALGEEHSSVMRAAVVSVLWDPGAELSPFDGLGFSLAETGRLEFLGRLANMVMYSEDGEADLEKQGKAMFLIGPAIGPAALASGAVDRRSFVEQCLRTTARHHDFEIESVEPVTVDALEGFEVVATAVSDSGVPTTIYQLILFEGVSYWRGGGLVRSSESESFLPMFRKMGRSLVRDVKHFESEGGVLRVTAPSGWTELDLNDEADLQIGHATAQCYLMVLTDAKTNLEEEMTVDDHSKVTRDSMKANAGVTLEVGPRRLEIGGCEAVQYDLHASEDGTSFVFIHTTLDDGKHFHQVLAWAPADGFVEARATLDSVIASIVAHG